MEKIKTAFAAAGRDALPKKTAQAVLCALIGWCLSSVKFESAVSPFAAAFAAGAPGLLLLPSALGGALGALMFRSPMAALKYAGTLTLICVLRSAHDRLFRGDRTLVVYPLICFASLFASGSAVLLAVGFTWTRLLITLCEALAAGACACFFHRVFLLLPAKTQPVGSSAGDAAALLISGGALLLAVDSFRIGSVSPARCVAYLGLLTLSFSAGEGAGAAAGIVAGVLLSFSEGAAFLAYLLPAAGLLCGILSGYGRLLCAGTFTVASAAFILLRGESEAAFVCMLEAAGAALAFALIPRRAMDRIASFLRPLSRERFAGETRALLRLRLRGEAKAVRDVADSVRAVCRLQAIPRPPAPKAAAERVRAELCGSCEKRVICWEHHARDTQTAFSAAFEALSGSGALSGEDLPEPLASLCRVPGTLAAVFTRVYCEMSARAAAVNEICDVKSLAAAQFGSLAAVLEDAAENAGGAGETDPYLAALSREVFTGMGFETAALCVSEDPSGKLRLEAFCTRLPRLSNYNLLLEGLYEKTGVRFMPPVADEYKQEGTVLCFCEKTVLHAEFHRRVTPANGEELCGDTVRIFPDGRGNLFCVLSDGMGTGRTAAIDSVMTCTLFSRMMKAGFTPEAALCAVNCAMMVKSEDETLATLDVLRLDLNTGEASFFKAGGAFSVVRRSGRTAVTEPSSLPLGIMREVKFERSDVRLSAGDAVVMLSDGAASLNGEFFKDLFYEHKQATPAQLTKLVTDAAAARAPIGHRDDITVVCVVLK